MNDRSQSLKGIFDLLRNREYITGIKALKIVTSFIALKLLDGSLQLSDYEGYIDDQFVEYNVAYVNLSALTAVTDPNWDKIGVFRRVWKEILAVHPRTRDYFPANRLDDIEHDETVSMLLDKFKALNLDSNDILGQLYEDTFNADQKTRKELGQFFTPLPLRQLMVQMVQPKPGESVYDPAMGTGGLLISALDYMRQYGPVDADTIRHTFGGREVEVDTYQLAATNMLIHMGFTPDDVRLGDSIRAPTTNTYDIVVANPPFGIKGIVYETLNVVGRSKEEYIPFKTNIATLLFLQAIIATLKPGGRCALVLPNGQEMFSEQNADIRQYLLESCDLKEIVRIEGKSFTNTGVKTVILYFIKGQPTQQVLFTSFDGVDKKNIDIKTIQQIRDNNYNLYLGNYLKRLDVQEDDDADVALMKLRDAVDIKRGKSLTKANAVYGPYPVIGGGAKPSCYHNAYNRDANTILCSAAGTAGYISRYPCPVWASGCFSLIPKEGLDNDYLYFYLKTIQEEIYSLRRGAGQPNVSAKDLGAIEIPIPSLEQQRRLVESYQKLEQDIQDVEDSIAKLKLEIENIRQQQREVLQQSLRGKVKRVSSDSPVGHSTSSHSSRSAPNHSHSSRSAPNQSTTVRPVPSPLLQYNMNELKQLLEYLCVTYNFACKPGRSKIARAEYIVSILRSLKREQVSQDIIPFWQWCN